MVIATQTKISSPAQTNAYEVKFATTFAEIDAAMRLRFEVFNLELNEGLRSSYEKGYDSDAYDAWCDHLIVKDRSLNKVVGAYRLLRQSNARRGLGFYSENEFDLGNLRNLPGESLELGRSCVARDHRSFSVINLLWVAITQYAIENRIRRLFGCCSLHCATVEEAQPIYDYLRARHFSPEPLRVYPHEAYRIAVRDGTGEMIEKPENNDEQKVWRRLPPLLKGYLRAGAVICGAPAFDPEFGTADVFALLDMEKFTAPYKQRYRPDGRP
jgi:putative hemolysin